MSSELVLFLHACELNFIFQQRRVAEKLLSFFFAYKREKESIASNAHQTLSFVIHVQCSVFGNEVVSYTTESRCV